MAGNIPLTDDLILTRGADFVATYRPAPGDPAIHAMVTAIHAGTDRRIK